MLRIRSVIADDDELSNRQLGRLLAPFAQLEVVGVAQDGQKAVELVDRLEPDLLFLDIEMPRMSGFQVLQAIKHKPVVIITTAHTEYRQLVIESDAIDCLYKPFDPEQLRKVMGKIDRIVRVMGRLGAPADES